MMEDKIFDIQKTGDNIKIQIGKNNIRLDNNERTRILNLFSSIKETETLFPAGLEGACLMYPNGIIALNISVAKITATGTRYLLFLYHLNPNSSDYNANTFMLTDSVLDRYIKTLSIE
jgi:hypothetical protein